MLEDGRTNLVRNGAHAVHDAIVQSVPLVDKIVRVLGGDLLRSMHCLESNVQEERVRGPRLFVVVEYSLYFGVVNVRPVGAIASVRWLVSFPQVNARATELISDLKTNGTHRIRKNVAIIISEHPQQRCAFTE